MKRRATTVALLREAASWRLTGLLFERPVDGWHAEVRTLAAEIEDPLLRASAGTIDGFREGIYLAVLGPGGSVSPREVAYRPMGDPGKILAALLTVYDAFGYRTRAEDPPDHISVLAGFLGFLKMKEAFAVERGEKEERATTRAAFDSVVEDHLDGFAGELAERLHGAPRHLELAAEALLALSGLPEKVA